MKRFRITALVGAVVGLWLFLTGSLAAEVRGGLKIGLNLAHIHGSDTNDFPHYDSSWFLRFGFCAGGFITIDISRIAAFQAEGLMTMKGSKEPPTISVGYPTYKHSLSTSYLEIPLLIRLMTPPPRNTRFFLLAGPAVGIKLSGNLKRDSETMTSYGLKSAEMGLVLGIGSVRKSRILTEVRYTLGLTKIVEQDGMTLDIKNGVFSLMVGYIF